MISPKTSKGCYSLDKAFVELCFFGVNMLYVLHKLTLLFLLIYFSIKVTTHMRPTLSAFKRLPNTSAAELCKLE